MQSSLRHALILIALFCLLPWRTAAASPTRAATTYSCALYGYTFVLPAGWHMTKPDSLKCKVKAGDFTSQSSPTFFSPSGRAFLQIDVIANSSYSATQWIREYTALLGISAKSFKIGSATVNHLLYSVVADSVVTKDSSGASSHLFLAIAGVQHHGRLYGFLGGVGLDNNPSPNGDAGQLRNAFTSLKLR